MTIMFLMGYCVYHLEYASCLMARIVMDLLMDWLVEHSCEFQHLSYFPTLPPMNSLRTFMIPPINSYLYSCAWDQLHQTTIRTFFEFTQKRMLASLKTKFEPTSIPLVSMYNSTSLRRIF